MILNEKLTLNKLNNLFREEVLTGKSEISDEELASLTLAIKTRHGIDFTNYEPKSLKRGFGRVISKNNLGNLLGLWGKILRDRDFLMKAIDELTVNLTELFRNPEIWVYLNNTLLPKKVFQKEINFWHAGCSTGEEVYTTAIVLKERKMLFKSKALATDLSQTALAGAIEGKYSKLLTIKYSSSLKRALPNVKMEDCFNVTNDYAEIKPEFKSHVTFKKHNLVQDPAPGGLKHFDFIFCRNVMIYFDDKLKIKVLESFHRQLKDDGYFIIGYYDMLPEESKKLFALHDGETRVYKKVI